MPDTNIYKAKLKKGVRLEVDYTEKLPDGKRDKHEKCPADVHSDLRHAFAQLSKHLGAITEQYNADGELVSRDIEFRGFSIKGEFGDDNYGFTLTGIRTLSTLKTVVLNSPFLRFDEVEEYADMDQLIKDLKEAQDEVYKYLFENKHAPEIQGKLFTEETKEEPEP